MAPHLEQRRQAIAAALRAVMAEPLPRKRPVVADRAPVAEPPPPRTLPTLAAQPPVAELPRPWVQPIVAAQPPVAAPPPRIGLPEMLSVREALAASIEWDEVEDLTEDGEVPSVPPLEVAGSMSRAASVALFGHA